MPFDHVVAIIQGRMNSSRLPGKVLLDIAGKPMLERVVERARRSKSIGLVVVATTTDPSDDPVDDFCMERGYSTWRGDMFDVLDRYYMAACHFEADIIVRLTADCPVVDPDLVDSTVQILDLNSDFPQGTDFSCNRLPPPWKRSFPIGLDVEVCRFATLERAWRESDQKFQREHVMPYVYEGLVFPESPMSIDNGNLQIQSGTSPRGFHVTQLHHKPDHGSLRWTVDTPQDLEVMRNVFSRLGRDDFTWQDVLSLQQKEPGLFSTNASVEHKTAFDVDERQNKD